MSVSGEKGCYVLKHDTFGKVFILIRYIMLEFISLKQLCPNGDF